VKSPQSYLLGESIREGGGLLEGRKGLLNIKGESTFLMKGRVPLAKVEQKGKKKKAGREAQISNHMGKQRDEV